MDRRSCLEAHQERLYASTGNGLGVDRHLELLSNTLQIAYWDDVGLVSALGKSGLGSFGRGAHPKGHRQLVGRPSLASERLSARDQGHR